MLRTCDLKLPLIYNTHDLNDEESPNQRTTSERHFIFEERPKDCLIDSEFLCTLHGNVISSSLQEVTISLFTEEGKDKKNDQLFCEIKGLLVSDEIFAYTIAEGWVNKICKNLSLLISRHNSDQQNIQPRVEPNWQKAVWTISIYQPVKRIETDQGHQLQIADRIGFRETLQFKAQTRLPSEEVDIHGWLKEQGDDYNFLLNEFYTALGEEKPKSKFFHLFSIIEFCEREYASYNGAERLLTDEEIRELGRKLRDEIKDKHSGVDVCNIVSRVQKVLTDSTTIGRVEKLQNILTAMGITQYKDGIKMTEINKKLLKDITTLRNKSFHGTAIKNTKADSSPAHTAIPATQNSATQQIATPETSQINQASKTEQTTQTSPTAATMNMARAGANTVDAVDNDREYSNAVVILLSICEQILAFVESGGVEGVKEVEDIESVGGNEGAREQDA